MIFSISGLKAQEFREVQFDEVHSLLSLSNDTLYLIDFWATWCKPCVEELAYIDELTELYADRKFKVILISMDFQSQVESKFIPFLEERKLKSTVWYLNEKKFGKFIPKVEKEWSGALPFTLIFRTEDNLKLWHEGIFEKEELYALIEAELK